MAVHRHQTDVLIVGGGPSGASAAISLLNYSDLSVTLVEQTDFNKIRVGEHVSASIFDLIDYLQLAQQDFDPGSFIPMYGSTTYWGSDQSNTTHAIFTTEDATYQLDREKFDFTLIETASLRGASIFPRSKCSEYKQLEDKSWEVLLKHPIEGNVLIEAQYLVDATGRNGNVCRQLNVLSQKYDALMGVGVFLKHNQQKPRFEQTLEATELGWWYTAMLPDDSMVVTFFTDADIITKHKLNQADAWNGLLQETKHIKILLQNTTALTKKPWVRHAHTQLSNANTRQRFIAIGDASASFDPISSMGIGFGISSACQAATHIRHELATNEVTKTVFQQDIAANFKNYLQLRSQFYTQERRWPNSEFWKRRQ